MTTASCLQGNQQTGRQGRQVERLTFAQIALPDETPQHVGAVVAVARPVKRLLAEEMSVSPVAVERVGAANVVPVGARIGGGGGGHFGQNEMRAAEPRGRWVGRANA